MLGATLAFRLAEKFLSGGGIGRGLLGSGAVSVWGMFEKRLTGRWVWLFVGLILGASRY